VTRVCDIRELPSVNALVRWARDHRARVRYLGTTLEGRAVYGATRGPVTRVARSAEPDPHPRTLAWESPLEHLW
jgi:hypothetical protein